MDSSIWGDTSGWGIVVGVVLPWLTAIVQQPGWSPTTRRIVSVVAAAIAGVLTVLATGEGLSSSGATYVQTIGAVLVASQASYAALTRTSAQKIEENVLNLHSGPRGGRHGA